MLLPLLLALLFLYSLTSQLVERSFLTAPILFTGAGIVLVPVLDQLGQGNVEPGILLQLAEVGLVLLLFTDASRTKLSLLRDIRALPARLLGIGMPFTLLAGAGAALLIFPQFSLWEAGILAAILAPTDAGLGQVIVKSKKVPEDVREALNVEAGLNDGISVPFLLFFMAVCMGGTDPSRVESGLLEFVKDQLGYGLVIGGVLGWVGGRLIGMATRRGWMSESFTQIAVVIVPILCLLASEAVGASMFIAAFVAGLAIQPGYAKAGQHAVEFTEDWGQMLNLSVFFLFGTLVARGWDQLGATAFFYAALSLTIVRMLPVVIALAGTGLNRRTVMFMGWFGPRGLASIVLGLVYLEEHGGFPGEALTIASVMATVLLSIVAHGISAKPGIALLAKSS